MRTCAGGWSADCRSGDRRPASRQELPQGQRSWISGPGQQPEGHRRVGGEHQQRAVGDGRRHRRRQEPQRGLERRQDRRRQQSPGQGEGQAHPPPEIAREAGVVPEPHAQQPVVEQVDAVLRRRGGQAAPQGPGPEAACEGRGQGQHRQGPQAVHRADGQQKGALAHRPLAGDGVVGALQQIAEEAVCPECPEPERHGRAHLLRTSLPAGGGNMRRCAAEDFVVRSLLRERGSSR